jgi:hypothetical protein
MRWWASFVGLVTLALLAGCGPDSSTSAARPATSTGSAAGSATETPAAVYARVRSAVLTAGSGAFSQRSIGDLGDGSVTITLDGSYDLKARIWEGQVRYQSDSPTFRKGTPDPAKLTTNYRAIGADTYISEPAWPTAMRGRWSQTTTKQSAGRAASIIGGPQAASPETLAALLALTPTGVRKTGSGWTLTGRVGANQAVPALGLAKGLSQQGVDVATLQGSAEVSVDLGADSRPTELRIDGSSVTLTSKVPDALRKALAHEHGVLDLLEFGQPVTVKAPTGHELITPTKLK